MAELLEALIFEEIKLWSLIILCLSRSKYARKKQWREENRGQQLQSSFALLEHFPKFIFYILYTISKLRKSRIQRSNRVRFGAEMRKIWPLEDNCIKLRDNFARWKSRCEILSPLCENFAHLKPTCEIGTQRAKIGYFCRLFFF